MTTEVTPSVDEQLAQAREQITNLQVALASCRRIGIAMGIVMARRELTDDEAFAALRSESQRQHRKIRDIANDVIYTGDL